VDPEKENIAVQCRQCNSQRLEFVLYLPSRMNDPAYKIYRCEECGTVVWREVRDESSPDET